MNLVTSNRHPSSRSATSCSSSLATGAAANDAVAAHDAAASNDAADSNDAANDANGNADYAWDTSSAARPIESKSVPGREDVQVCQMLDSP